MRLDSSIRPGRKRDEGARLPLVAAVVVASGAERLLLRGRDPGDEEDEVEDQRGRDPADPPPWGRGRDERVGDPGKRLGGGGRGARVAPQAGAQRPSSSPPSRCTTINATCRFSSPAITAIRTR